MSISKNFLNLTISKIFKQVIYFFGIYINLLKLTFLIFYFHKFSVSFIIVYFKFKNIILNFFNKFNYFLNNLYKYLLSRNSNIYLLMEVDFFNILNKKLIIALTHNF